MAQPEARAWWADVQDLRARIEERRAADPAASPRTADPGMRAASRPMPRRTVQITGHGSAAPAPRPLFATRPRALDAATRRPDRIAGWAALLGLVLVFVSTATH